MRLNISPVRRRVTATRIMEPLPLSSPNTSESESSELRLFSANAENAAVEIMIRNDIERAEIRARVYETSPTRRFSELPDDLERELRVMLREAERIREAGGSSNPNDYYIPMGYHSREDFVRKVIGLHVRDGEEGPYVGYERGIGTRVYLKREGEKVDNAHLEFTIEVEE